MALSQELKNALEKTNLTFEEVRAFSAGLAYLNDEEQEEFLRIIKEDPDLIYPLYINFKAKLHAANGSDEEWDAAIEQELAELEEFMSRNKNRVGGEIS